MCHTGLIFSIGDLKACPDSDKLPPRPQLPIVTFPVGQAIKYMSIWKTFLFKPPEFYTGELGGRKRKREMMQLYIMPKSREIK